ncbi:PREDICTED: E3 ubiquitin-protein ligase RNF125, partial [Apaloderma vittatum]|uniref:E3 ubiquitin-protein ligase RNF125 n=1 Tax=Apaloderma vittatum TaxID=57397 RepID=UPI0005212708
MYDNRPSCRSLQSDLGAHPVGSVALGWELGLTPSPNLASHFYTCVVLWEEIVQLKCDSLVCLSKMRAHLRTCEKYIKKYGSVQDLGDAVTRYSCPYCQCEGDENEIMDHCLTHHRSERKPMCCPICCLTSGRHPSYFSGNCIRHLQLRHTLRYEDYIVSNGIHKLLDLISLCASSSAPFTVRKSWKELNGNGLIYDSTLMTAHTYVASKRIAKARVFSSIHSNMMYITKVDSLIKSISIAG